MRLSHIEQLDYVPVGTRAVGSRSDAASPLWYERSRPETPRARSHTLSRGGITLAESFEKGDLEMTAVVAGGARANAAPFLNGSEHAALSEALTAGQFGHGPLTERFEHEVARFLGVPDVVAVASGTAALQIGLMVAGVGDGDEVIVPSQTFCATIQAIVSVGARPRFIEVNPNTMCVDASDVLAAITPTTRAVMPVLYGGRAVDLSDLRPTLDSAGIQVIEDAAHAFGSRLSSRLGSRPVGGTGLLTCFSFGPIKNLTCGQGGALVPRDAGEAETARRIRMLGIARSQPERSRSTSYQVESIGIRAPMSSLNAAIGLAQLQTFGEVAAKRQRLWRAYQAGLADIDGVQVVDVDVERTVPFNCVVRIPDRDRIFATLREVNIGVGVHYPPNHLQPAFSQWHRALPRTEALAREIMSLPFHPAMSLDDIEYVVSALAAALRSPSGSTSGSIDVIGTP